MSNDYNPSEYWGKRFKLHKMRLRGVGDKTQTERRNRIQYRAGAVSFLDLYCDIGVDFTSSLVLDIGCGNGYYANVLRDLGIKNYLGIDITDVLFPELKGLYPDRSFLKLNVSKEGLPGKFDLIIMLDVDQHIVDDDLFSATLWNIRANLNVGGYFIVTSLLEDRGRIAPHVRCRGMEVYKKAFGDSSIGDPRVFRDKFIFAIKKEIPFPLSKKWTIEADGRQFVIFSREGDELEKAFSVGDFYELELLQHIQSHKKRGLYVDAGANIGNHSIWFSAMCDSEKVIAIEPSPLLAGLTGDAIKENRLDNVQVIEAAAAAKEGAAYLSSFYPKNAGKTQVVSQGAQGEEILCRTLDSIWEESGNAMPVSVLKIDVEGMEFEVLQGAAKIIQQFHPLIYAEWRDGDARKKITQFLAPFGYKLGPRFGRISEWALEEGAK